MQQTIYINVGNKQKQTSMKKIIFGIITLSIISCNEKPKAEFSLNGTTNSIEDGTILYMLNTLNSTLIDSTEIYNNSFNYQTKLPKSPLQIVLHTKNNSHFSFLWLENNPMTFDASKTEFRNAIVTGSKTNILMLELMKNIDSLPRNEHQKVEIEFVKNNPNSIISASLLSGYSTTWGKEKTVELFEPLSIENKNSEYGKKILKYIELNKNPKIGEQFVDFEMSNQNDIRKKLSDYKGKTILLEFWASWCGPCLNENPNLVKTYKRFNSYGFEVFAVSLDTDKASWLKEIKKSDLIWEHVSDLKGRGNEASLIYGINGIPDNFLIDRNGIIIGRNLRGDKLNEKLIEIIPVANTVYTQ